MRKWAGSIALSVLMISLTVAQPQLDKLMDPFAYGLPQCASSCKKLFDVQQACIPPLAESSSSQSCFCNDVRLKQFLEGPSGVAAVCISSNASNASNASNYTTSSKAKHTYSVSVNAAGEVIIDSRTVPPNGLFTIGGGEVITLAPQATKTPVIASSSLPPLEIGSSSLPLTLSGAFSSAPQLSSVVTQSETIATTAFASATPISSVVIAGQTITPGGQITIGDNVLDFPLVTKTGLGRRSGSPATTTAPTAGSCTAATDFQGIEKWYQNYCKDEEIVVRKSGLSKGAQAGIGAGAAILGIFIISSISWFCFRTRKQNQDIDPTPTPGWDKAEMEAGVPRSEGASELGGEDKRMELVGDGGDLELAGDYIRAELEGDYGWVEVDGEKSVVNASDSQKSLVSK